MNSEYKLDELASSPIRLVSLGSYPVERDQMIC
jgi:hypothetical protein